MMRVLYLSPWFPYPLDTGSRTRVYYLLRALAERHRVTMLSLDPQGWAPAQVEAVAPFCEQALVVPRDPFRRNRLRMATRFFSLRPVVADPFPEMLRLVNELHNATPFDMVIAGTGIMAPYALALPDVVHVLEEHNSMTRWMLERHTEQSSPLQQLRCWVSWQKTRHYEAGLFSHFDLITMVSEQDRAATVSIVGDNGPRVEVIPNGVDCTHNRPGLSQPRPNALVYNGSLTYSANYDAMHWFLAQVYSIIKTEQPGVSLTITGSTRGVDLAGLALDDTVALTGFVDDVRIPVAEAVVAVAPIRQGGGTRLKILEAMALGTPVVATSKGAEGLDVVDGEHLLLADDPATFAARTVELLSNPDLRQRLDANARRLVETRYDWAEIGQRFVALVEETVRTRRALSPGRA